MKQKHLVWTVIVLGAVLTAGLLLPPTQRHKLQGTITHHSVNSTPAKLVFDTNGSTIDQRQ